MGVVEDPEALLKKLDPKIIIYKNLWLNLENMDFKFWLRKWHEKVATVLCSGFKVMYRLEILDAAC